MSIDFIETISAGRKKPQNVLAEAISIAIRDAEIHDTNLIVKTKHGKIESLKPSDMKKSSRNT